MINALQISYPYYLGIFAKDFTGFIISVLSTFLHLASSSVWIMSYEFYEQQPTTDSIIAHAHELMFISSPAYNSTMLRIPIKHLARISATREFSNSTSQNLSPRDLDKLNKTSTKLYRIILKSLRDSTKSSSGQFKDHILLQPPLNHRDYGAAQFLRSHECMHWCDQLLPYQSPSMKKQDTQLEIISFFNWWVHDNNDALENELVDAYVMDEMDPEGLANLLEKTVFVSYDDLRDACRQGFRMFLEGDEVLDKVHILELQRFAIESIRVLQDMQEMSQSTSISVDEGRGLRIIATSRYVFMLMFMSMFIKTILYCTWLNEIITNTVVRMGLCSLPPFSLSIVA